MTEYSDLEVLKFFYLKYTTKFFLIYSLLLRGKIIPHKTGWN